MNQAWVLLSEWPDVWTILAALSGTSASIAAIIGLFAAWRQLRHNETAMQMQVFEVVFRDIRDLDERYIASWEQLGNAERRAWSASFFNTVEYLVFLMNHDVIRNESLREYFDIAVPHWQRMFNEHVSTHLLNGDGFRELKEAASRLKESG